MTSASNRSAVQPIAWLGDRLRLLDQRLLPLEETYLDCRSAAEVAEAIHGMAVRGAPAIGIAAAYGLVLGVRNPAEGFEAAEKVLAASRPTAVNLRWALARLRGLWQRGADAARTRSAPSKLSLPARTASTRP